MEQPYEKTHMLSTRRWKRGTMLAAIGAAAIALAAIGVWMSPGGGQGREIGTGQRRFETGTLNQVGTGGVGQVEGTQNSGPAATPVTDPVDALTAPSKVRHLVGRNVQIQSPIGQHINDVAFWASYENHPLLVVLSRDTRDDSTRQRGDPSLKGWDAPAGVGYATLSGRIEPLPRAEAMYSWGLTNPDRKRLLEWPVYLKVARVE